MTFSAVKRILSVGIPYGIENGMFYFGRLLILSLVSTFGTASIAANSVSTLIASFEVLPGMAIGLGLTTVISQCVGANDYNQTKYYTKKIIAIIYISQTITSIIILSLLPFILHIYHLSAEATSYTYKLSWYHAVMMIIWPLGYSLPVVFRASGDAKFPMAVASISMIVCRIVLAYVFALYFHNFSTFLTRKGLYLEDIFIDPDYRGKGYGKAIMRYLANLAVKGKCGRFEWVVLEWNQPAIGFYEKVGATVLPDWRLCRLTGEALECFAKGS